MKRLFSLLLFVLGFFFDARADHITGGEMYYTLKGVANGGFRYGVTFKLYRRCDFNRDFENPATLGVFNKRTNERIKDISVSLTAQDTIRITEHSHCITNPPEVCYIVGRYEFEVVLPPSADGYILSGQVVYRISTIQNLSRGYGRIGATYTAEIPGTNPVANGPENNSAHFTGDDLVVICADNTFSYSFAADDADGDSLRYSFCSAYQGGTPQTLNGAPPQNPPYYPVPHHQDFPGDAPLGGFVTINPKTGLITGIAPKDDGVYLITVCVEEIRNGQVIATQRKDIQINIAPCTIAGAKLLPEYMLCRESKTITLFNLTTSFLIEHQNWELRNSKDQVLLTSESDTITYTFADTGTYKIKLAVNRGQECSDSTTSLIRVYPGFKPVFNVSGTCLLKPTNFTDATTTVYGTVSSWKWDFGEPSRTDDVSSQKSPSYTYPVTGTKNIRLVVGNSKGCVDTAFKTIELIDKPALDLVFRDTLICRNDVLQLLGRGEGLFQWSPATGLSDPRAAAPMARPLVTTKYYVDYNNAGCTSRDSVTVNVVDVVTLRQMGDTVVCTGDTVHLRLESNALRYSWQPAAPLSNAAIREPVSVNGATTTYSVTGTIGGCTATASIRVATVPYPTVSAGPDLLICYNATTQLQATTDGSTIIWRPAGSLSNSGILDPVASPRSTTDYLLYVYDTKGCLKPGIDTVRVSVMPRIVPFAGRDTTVVIGQPLPLLASGGVRYEWSPATGLSHAAIPNPVALYSQEYENIRYRVYIYDAAECLDSAFLQVKVYKTIPTIFVPTAFTPNRDGKNDFLKPIAVGMQRIEYFTVYNRWGQTVFTSNGKDRGWDGTINGSDQGTGTFVWAVKAIDYKGNVLLKKGTTVLIR